MLLVSVSYPDHDLGQEETPVEFFDVPLNATVEQLRQEIFGNSKVVSAEEEPHSSMFISGGTQLGRRGAEVREYAEVALLLEQGEVVSLEVRRGQQAEEGEEVRVADTLEGLGWCGSLAKELGEVFREIQRLNGKSKAPGAAEAIDELASLVLADVEGEQATLDLLKSLEDEKQSLRDSNNKRWSQRVSADMKQQRSRGMTADLLGFIMEEELGVGALRDTNSSNSRPLPRASVAPFGRKPLLEEVPGWRLELGHEQVDAFNKDQLQIERADSEGGLYAAHFVGREHENFVGEVDGIGPVSVSVIETNEDGRVVIRALIRTKYGEQMRVVDGSQVRKKFMKKKRETTNLLQAVSPMFSSTSLESRKIAVRRVKEDSIKDSLHQIEEQMTVKAFKFGVLYRRAGQNDENEMFQNCWEETSEHFRSFLDLLGKRVTLLGFDKFRGGLDVKSGSTGDHSYYRKWEQFEVMFHVAPLLPFYEHDEQQLERKRHLGNDIVLLVFQDEEETFIPGTVKSEFIHVIFVVTRVGNNKYRLGMSCQDKIPFFGPVLPADPTFTSEQLVSFFFTKAINSELAALRAPAFKSKLQGARNRLLQSLAKTF